MPAQNRNADEISCLAFSLGRRPVENAARLGDDLVLGLLLLSVLPKHLHDGDDDHDNEENNDDDDHQHHAPPRSPAHLHQGRRPPQAASLSGSCRCEYH